MSNFNNNGDKIVKAANMLKAIAHPIRMQVVELLENDNSLNVTEIYSKLKIEQAVASHHLTILKDRDVLQSERDGKHTFYSLKHKQLSQIIQCIYQCLDE
jgi:DNA-binding transcriptional ArsR family regulator